MTKLLTVLAASALTFTSWQINAGEVTTTGGANATTATDTTGTTGTTNNTQGAVDSGPPAQQQKDQVPNSTSTGNYLEPQVDENGATQNSTDKKAVKNSTQKGVKATNIEKSKKVTETPDSGGMDVK